ncbi:MAG: hypothetical protein NTU41_01120 [Chloroflexi bacterium]|nr:hypothetical protein [Chloroflexota bacterium]
MRRSVGRVFAILGVALIVAPEPFSTVPGIILVLIAVIIAGKRRSGLAPCSGIVMRQGSLPK